MLPDMHYRVSVLTEELKSLLQVCLSYAFNFCFIIYYYFLSFQESENDLSEEPIFIAAKNLLEGLFLSCLNRFNFCLF